MARSRWPKGPSPSEIDQLKIAGLNQSEIAEQYGVTRQAVSFTRTKYSVRMTPREKVLKEFPWTVSTLQTQQAPYRLMRDHGWYIAGLGHDMPEERLKRLRSWYRKLKQGNLVLEFDPSLPPIPGVANKGGFAYRTRTPADGDLLIKVNDHTRLTEQGKMIWRFPLVEP